MCLSPKDLSRNPSAATACVNPPQIDFEDPVNGGLVTVGISTLLGTPEHFGATSRPPSSSSVEIGNRKRPNGLDGCQNRHYATRGRRSTESATRGNDSYCYGQKVLAKAHSFFYFSGIRHCANPPCESRKRALEKSAPPCSWMAFRDVIITCIACWEPAPEINNFDPIVENHKHNSSVIQWSDIPAVFCLDILGMIDVWIWATRLAFGPMDGMMEELEMHRPIDFNQLWQGLSPGHSLRAVESSRRLNEYGMCLKRLWNVSLQSPNGVADISHVVDTALGAPLVGIRGKHSECTEEHCLYSHENSTLVKQSHKCPSGKCTDEITFPPEKLNHAFENVNTSSNSLIWYNTAWRVQTGGERDRSRTLRKIIPSIQLGEKLALCNSDTSYMAISHVWSDGTGVGMKSPGCVNTCLYEYFRKISQREECACDGIWWDSISIPTERKARAAAINSMLENYQRAKVTLVHDQDLVNFEWRDDGSPAVALVLSSWFTRGWTAAELWASRNHPVKVVFKDPSSNEPLIKDLYDDILGGDLSGWLFDGGGHPGGSPSFKARVLDPSGNIPTLGHLIATDILALLWRPGAPNTTVGDISSLLQILRPRTTSWARDRMIISGLMCLLPSEMDQSISGSEITQRILTKLGTLKVTELLSHSIPIVSIGPWDWCPQSIFDFAQSFVSNAASGDYCEVQRDGRLRGDFLVYEVLYNDVISAYRPHPALAARVSVALSARNKCLLLTTATIQQQQTYILFQPMYLNDRTIAGRWVGSVSLKSPLGGSRRNFHSGEVGYGELGVEFGNDMSEIGMPLPIISFESTVLARVGFSRSRPRSKASWLLSEHLKGGSLQFLPQTIYLYSHSIRPEAGNGKELSIRWSFPYHQWGYIYCEDIIRVIFLSTFHISDSLADAEGPCQILLGLTDFEKQIRPHSQREDVGGGRTEKLFVETCMPCHRCDTCIKSYRRK
ncbi:hypothetical protein F4823DRAFT_564802 [Ustulina deusta]|nr:hypothetical protein F4823DRAFT_564802 [Ustulina deusta]